MPDVVCTRCLAAYGDGAGYHYTCARCGGILDVAYDLERVRGGWSPQALAARPRGLERWRELLPLPPGRPLVSLGEGDTPLIQAPDRLDCRGVRVLLKLEGCNPTGSFKDRAVAVAITRAAAAGAPAVVVSSTGNAGAAVAAYAARRGLPAVVLVPAGTPPQHLARIAAYGARLVRVEGDVSAPFHLAHQAAQRFGWVNLATTYLSPYPTEGDKTAGYEIAMQLDWQAPDWVVVPVGDGPLLFGCYKAFTELHALGLVPSVPRFAAVQASGCAPIYRAWQAGAAEVEPWDAPATIAWGIADPLKGYPQDGTFTLAAVRASKGTVVAVSDAEILAARDDLARRCGVLAEPTGAVPLAGLRQMVRTGQVLAGQTAVLLITGHGLAGQFPPVPDLPVVGGDLAAVEAVVEDLAMGREG